MKIEEAILVDKFLSNIDKVYPKFYWIIMVQDEAKKKRWSREAMKVAFKRLDEIYDDCSLHFKII
jgi:hypothetical protein